VQLGIAIGFYHSYLEHCEKRWATLQTI